MKTVCEACLSEARSLEVSGGPFGLVKCGNCGLVSTNPMPSDQELVDYYQGFNFEAESAGQLRMHLPAIEKSLRHFVGKGQGRFLDYGGGSGIYAVAAENLGWQADLFDYDAGMTEFGRNDLGLHRAYSNWEDVGGEYDVIFAYHVVEHWNSLKRHFESLLDRLSPGGSMVFATPNALSKEKSVRDAHRRRYEGILVAAGLTSSAASEIMDIDDSVTCWDPPRHLFAFTPAAMRQLGKQYGLLTKVWTGYNISPLFEPRRYVVPTISRSVKGSFSQMKSNRRQGLRSLLNAIKLEIAMRGLQARHPEMGEQLYVKFTKR